MTIIDKLRRSIAGAISNKRHKSNRGQEVFKGAILGLPDILVKISSGSVVEQIGDIIESLDLNFSQLENWKLADEVTGGIKWAISQMVSRIPMGGRMQVEALARMFKNLVISEQFNRLCIDWAQTAQKSDDIGISIAYCEIVDAAIAFKAVWEESRDGTRQKERTVRLYSILCNQKVWLQKRSLISKACVRNNSVLNPLVRDYLTVPPPSQRFDNAMVYVSRKVEPPSLIYDQKQHERTLKELNAVVRKLKRLKVK